MPAPNSLRDLILWEDDDIFVINKPPFISTLDDRNDPHNLLALAKAYTPDAQAAHRLDKDTSGALAFARNPEAYRHLSLQFEHREINKIYHAVVDGIHDFQDTLVEIPILKLDDGTVTLSRQGKDATTHFTTLEAFRAHTLVECRPVTGRMHQIRIHLRHLKAPITGDLIYGGRPFLLSEVKRKFNLKKGAEEQPLMRRMALHAFRLEFADLAGNQRVVEAPYPKDFRALVRQLRENR